MAHYFSYFPKMYYDAVQDGTSSPKLVTDLLTRLKVRKGIVNEISALSTYSVVSGETPEQVSYKLYGTVNYYWVILLVNDIKDRFFDWPLSDQQFEDYVAGKYSNPNGIHHYEIVQTSGATTSIDESHKIEVNSTTSGATSVTNYEYERRLQDQKRLIKVLDQQYLSQFVEEFISKIKK